MWKSSKIDPKVSYNGESSHTKINMPLQQDLLDQRQACERLVKVRVEVNTCSTATFELCLPIGAGDEATAIQEKMNSIDWAKEMRQASYISSSTPQVKWTYLRT